MADRRELKASSVSPAVLFRKRFCPVPEIERPPIVIDLRPAKEFKKLHVGLSFNVICSKNGKVLADYSQSQYDEKWSQGVWWDREVILYSDTDVPKDNPVLLYLVNEGRARAVSTVKGGFGDVQKQYPFICTTSLKSTAGKRYPNEIVEGLLFLGDWGHAVNADSLKDLRIKRIITIHNVPDTLVPPPLVTSHLKATLADVETEDISQFLDPAVDFIRAAKAARERVLVHCGAGVSRSASLCVAFLIAEHGLSAAEALQHVKERRGNVQPNPGFWRALLAFAAKLGRPGPPPESFAGGVLHPTARSLGVAAGHPPTGREAVSSLLGEVEEDDDAAPGAVPSFFASPERRPQAPPPAPASAPAPAPAPTARAAPAAPAARPAGPAVPAVAGPHLEVSKDGAVVARVPVPPGAALVFGRSPECDVRMEHPSSSRRHAVLRALPGGQFTLQDEGSQHGTFVNGRRLQPGTPVTLQPGDVARFGAQTAASLVL